MPRYLLIALFTTLFALPAGAPLSQEILAPAQPDEPAHVSAPPNRLAAPLEPETKPADTSAPAPSRVSPEDICRTIEEAAADNALPVTFFTRLIWQESRFNERAVSPAGAQGIAQFMPGTANWRGLSDPFHPVAALQESATWLAELKRQYGNLGLAAAAYNAGPGRVQRWLSGRATLPGETRAYVRIITGRSADEWASSEPPAWDSPGIPQGVPCRELRTVAARERRPASELARNPDWAPWGVQLAGDWSQTVALSQYERLQHKFAAILSGRRPVVFRVRSGPRAMRHLVRVAENTRDAAEKLCMRLRLAGGNCLVSKNPPAAALAGTVDTRRASSAGQTAE